MKLSKAQLRKIIQEARPNRQSFGYYPPVDEKQRDHVLQILDELKEIFSTSVTQEYLDHAEDVLVDLNNYLLPY